MSVVKSQNASEHAHSSGNSMGHEGGESSGTFLAPPPFKVHASNPVQRKDEPQKGNDPTAPLKEPARFPGFLDWIELYTYDDAAGFIQFLHDYVDNLRWQLSEKRTQAPGDLAKFQEEALALKEFYSGGGKEVISYGELDEIKAFQKRFEKTRKAFEEAMANGPSTNDPEEIRKSRADLGKSLRKYRMAKDDLQKKMIPSLKDAQRAAFRGGDEDIIKKMYTAGKRANATLGVLDKTIQHILKERAVMKAGLNALKGRGHQYVSHRISNTLEILKMARRITASFDALSAIIDASSGQKTAVKDVSAGLQASVTLYSSAATLAGASAGVLAFANLYLGPMVGAVFNALDQLSNHLSLTRNRQILKMGELDAVMWGNEPGGRPMYSFMVRVMKADSPEEVPTRIPEKVTDYLLSNSSEFSAGTKGSDMPTKGALMWESLDMEKIREWVFYRRNSIWTLLYGNLDGPD